MRILLTGAKGFIGRHLYLAFARENDVEIMTFNRGDSIEVLNELVKKADVIFHCAGENRPLVDAAFIDTNVGLTKNICIAASCSPKRPRIFFTSSSQAELENSYGKSKLAAEEILVNLAKTHGLNVAICRLPGVFGKWCRPNYNSVVATFCHNVVNDIAINIDDPNKSLSLIFIDDVVQLCVGWLKSASTGNEVVSPAPVYQITVGELATKIERFKQFMSTVTVGTVGVGLDRALYSTFVSHFNEQHVVKNLEVHRDERGIFVEFLKTENSGQIAYFTAGPGVIRGEHYHNTKTERFLVMKGSAKFAFRNLITDERFELFVDGSSPQFVETIPGWVHSIQNIGAEDMQVLLWANEVFDRSQPDTFFEKV